MCGTFMRENREIQDPPAPLIGGRPLRERSGGTPGMHGCWKSDRLVVPANPPDNAVVAAEAGEERRRGKGNRVSKPRPGHSAGPGVSQELAPVGRAGTGEARALITPCPGACPGGARPEPGAQCGNPARWDLRGGPPARAVPTATEDHQRRDCCCWCCSGHWCDCGWAADRARYPADKAP